MLPRHDDEPCGCGPSAERINRRLWPEFRYSFLLISATVSIVILLFIIVAAVGIEYFNSDATASVFAIGIAFVTLRFQNAVRRLYYLDGLRKEAARAAMVYVAVLVLISFVMVQMKISSPISALLCIACANAASAVCFFIQNVDLRRPDYRMVVWAASRLWSTGRWLLISAEMSWLGNFGIIPLVGIMIGVEASGTLRVIQTLVTPMTQMNNVMLSIFIPKAAAALRRDRSISWWGIATKTMLVLGCINGAYSFLITIFGETALPHLFGTSVAGVTWMPIALATFGYVVESVRYGCNVVLLGIGATGILTISQTAALAAGAILIPLATIYLGLWGVIAAMTTANNIGTLVVVIYFSYLARRK